MAKERLKSPRIRAFIALDLPPAVRERLESWGREALTDPALRPVPAANLHLTLAFLNYVPERDVPRLAAVVHAIESAAPRIELRPHPIALPKRRPPQLFAIDAPSQETVALQAELERRLVEERLYEPEKRPFWSHLTVARVRKEKGKKNRPMRVTRAPDPLPDALLEPFRAVRLTLYRSTLRQAGAEYDPLAQLELPQGGKRGETDA